MAVAESRIGCSRKLALLQDFQQAMLKLIELHKREVAALLVEDFVLLAELRSKLEEGRKKKDGLIDLYRAHVESHGC